MASRFRPLTSHNVRHIARCLIIVALLLVGQMTGIARAGGSRSVAGHAGAQTAVQRCKQRNRPAGTVVVGVPFGANVNFTQLMGPALFDDLFMGNDALQLIPQMASVAPTVQNGGIQDGGQTIVIHLKRGLRWANGTKITAADVRFGWQVFLDPAMGGGCEWCDLVSRIDTPDRYTAVFHLKQKGPALLSAFAAGQYLFAPVAPWPTVWPGGWSNDPHQAALKLNRDPTWTFVGSGYPTEGPFYIASETATQAVLRPMKYYSTMSCGPHLARLVVRSYPSNAALLAAAAAHQVDLIPSLDPTLWPELQRHRDAYTAHLDPSFAIENIMFNQTATYGGKPNPLQDSRVRLALALALDKLRLTERALPLGQARASRLLAWTPWINTPQLVTPFADRSITGQWDPLANGGEGSYLNQTGTGEALADARRLLSQTPWKRGFSMDVYTTTDNATRQAEVAELAADWARLGVKVMPHFVSSGLLFANYGNGGILAHGLFQTALFAFGWGNDPNGFRVQLDGANIPNAANPGPTAENYARMQDRVIDLEFARGASTVDPTVRAQSYAAIQRELDQQGDLVMLYSRPEVWTDDGRVQGLKGNADGLVWNTWAWRLVGH